VNPQLSLKFHAFIVLDILVVKKSKLVKELFVNYRNVKQKIQLHVKNRLFANISAMASKMRKNVLDV
jgi:hypothetical protein